MKTNFWIICALAVFFLPLDLMAQSPLSGFWQGKGQHATTLSYTYESYDEVFLLPNDINGVPVFEEVSVRSVSLYHTSGLSDKLDLVFGLPYISTQGQASEAVLNELGFSNERSGIQDLSLYLKYRPMSLELGDARLDFLVSGGLQTPLGNYEVDEGLQSIIAIGNRARRFTTFGGAHLQSPNGLFLTTQIGYSLRSGRVPNALLGEIKAGYAGSKFYADLWLAGQTSDGGTNILAEGFDAFFPATDVSYHRLGANLYFPVTAGIGLSAGFQTFLSGRNVGQATGFSAGVTYQMP